MKNVFYLLMILTGTILLSGCDDKDKTDIMKEELQHHRFLLVKANGENVAPEKQAFIEFSEKLTFNGKMCNTFFGEASLNKDTITSKNLSSTQKYCSDDQQLNKLDGIVSDLFTNGAKVKIKHDYDTTYLELSNKNNELHFEVKDLM